MILLHDYVLDNFCTGIIFSFVKESVVTYAIFCKLQTDNSYRVTLNTSESVLLLKCDKSE